jgi:hypothetical protein
MQKIAHLSSSARSAYSTSFEEQLSLVAHLGARQPSAVRLALHRVQRQIKLHALNICKIWYLISRTVSEDDAHRDNIDDRSVDAVAVKPRALGAPLCGIGA